MAKKKAASRRAPAKQASVRDLKPKIATTRMVAGGRRRYISDA